MHAGLFAADAAASPPMNASGLARAVTLPVLGQFCVRRRSASGEMNIKKARSGPRYNDTHAEMDAGCGSRASGEFAHTQSAY